ncbi:MAG: WecB/TagA/CpsF family glycosyltransferase [Peptococcaceae bacterium]|nr:WecB/TagA/CpsF family glycosyltransferase [Peptococcaceae bacterium]
MRVDVLGVGIDCLSMEQVVAEIVRFVSEGKPRRVVTANPEMLYYAQHKPETKALLNQADLVTADGEGVVWAARFLRQPIPQRITGIDLLNAVFPVANSRCWRIFLLGAAPGIAAEAARRLKLQYPNIEFAECDGYFPASREPEVLAQIKQFAPQLLLVGLGAVRQEQWIADYLSGLNVPVAIGVGGSFDVWSGKLKRAPYWVQRIKLEWFYRLLSQPRRLKRQINLPKFVLAVVQQKYL